MQDTIKDPSVAEYEQAREIYKADSLAYDAACGALDTAETVFHRATDALEAEQLRFHRAHSDLKASLDRLITARKAVPAE